MSLVPEDPRPHQTLARIYEQRQDASAAEAAYRAAMELDPLDPNTYSSLARNLEEEPDLKPLAGVPAFKKFVAEIRRLEKSKPHRKRRNPTRTGEDGAAQQEIKHEVARTLG